MLSFPGAVAQEAAYAIWNLTVGHEKNSDAIARLGAVPKLAELLKSTSDIAQENAAGALMHITISQDGLVGWNGTHLHDIFMRYS